MTSLYHGVPENMIGSKLIPLNMMFETDRKLHKKYLRKYRGREEILERRIPLLDCLWNDVIQLLPVQPQKLFELQMQLGIIDGIPDYKYFTIDVNQLDPQKTVVYFKTAPSEENVTVQWLGDVNLETLKDVPPATVNYYKSMIGKKQPIFNYQFVPHVVYMGTIDVSNSTTITI